MVGAEAGTDRSGAMITYPMRTYPNVVMKARAIERIELGRRVCDAMEPESLPLRVERDARLGATLAAFAAAQPSPTSLASSASARADPPAAGAGPVKCGRPTESVGLPVVAGEGFEPSTSGL